MTDYDKYLAEIEEIKDDASVLASNAQEILNRVNELIEAVRELSDQEPF